MRWLIFLLVLSFFESKAQGVIDCSTIEADAFMLDGDTLVHRNINGVFERIPLRDLIEAYSHCTDRHSNVSANYTITDDQVLLVNAVADTDIDLPAPSTMQGCRITIKFYDGIGNDVTITTPSGLIVGYNDIDFSTDELIIDNVGDSVTIWSDGTNWYTI